MRTIQELAYDLADIVTRYGDVCRYQMGDTMCDLVRLYDAQHDADVSGKCQTLYFGIRPTGTALLCDAPNVFGTMRQMDHVCGAHEWYELRYYTDELLGWCEPVRVRL